MSRQERTYDIHIMYEEGSSSNVKVRFSTNFMKMLLDIWKLEAFSLILSVESMNISYFLT